MPCKARIETPGALWRFGDGKLGIEGFSGQVAFRGKQRQRHGLSASKQGCYGEQGDAVLIFVFTPQVEKKSSDGPIQSIHKISVVAKIFRAWPLRCFDLAGIEAAVYLEYQINFMAGRTFVVVKSSPPAENRVFYVSPVQISQSFRYVDLIRHPR